MAESKRKSRSKALKEEVQLEPAVEEPLEADGPEGMLPALDPSLYAPGSVSLPDPLPPAGMGWNWRVVERGFANPRELVAHPRNYKIHSNMQTDAAMGVLDSIGWIDDVKVNRRTGFIVNGHLRVTAALKAGQTSIPVSWLDLDEDEELLALATFDPLGHVYYQSDKEAIAQLVADLQPQNETMMKLVEDWTKMEKVALVPDLVIADPEDDVDAAEVDVDLSEGPVLSNIRQVVLLMSIETHDVFEKEVLALAAIWETRSQTDTVIKAIHDIYRQTLQQEATTDSVS